jgi:hypothetical protein
MNNQASRTLQQTFTTLAPAEVLTAAKQFFVRRNSIYSVFPEKEGPTYISMRGMGSEELVIGVAAAPDGSTQVTGSSYLFDQQIARFLATLPQIPSPGLETAPGVAR